MTGGGVPAVLRVVVAEDNYLVREGTRQLLEIGGAVEVVAAVGSADELLAAVEADPPDAVLTDIRMPPTFTTEGLRPAAAIRSRRPRFPVLLLSHHVEGGTALQLLRDEPAGVGYLLKDRVSHVAQLVAAYEN